MESLSQCDVDQMNSVDPGSFDGLLEQSSGPSSSSAHPFLPHHHHFNSKINIYHSSNGQNGYSQVMISSNMKTIGDCDTVNNNNNNHHHLPHLVNYHTQTKQEEEAQSACNPVVQSEDEILPVVEINKETIISDVVDLNVQSSNNGQEEEPPEIDIKISNVVSNFACRCHLNLKNIAMNGSNVVYKRQNGMLTMKIRNPRCTASIWSSGKVMVTGSNSEENARISARKIARILQKMGYNVRMSGFRIVNVLGIVDFPFGIRLKQFAQSYPKICSYEPELHPGATYKCDDIKGSLTIFQTGAITVTAPNVAEVEEAVEHIYPLVHDFQKDKPQDKHLAHMRHAREREELLKGTESKKRKRSHGAFRRSKRVRTEDPIFCVDDDGDDLIDDESVEEYGNITSESEAKSTSEDSSCDDDN